MKRYWTRIALGALLVFGLGLTGLAALQKGKAKVKSLLTTAATRLPLQLGNLGFRLDGRRIGEVVGLEITRRGMADLGRLNGLVELSDARDAELLSDCALTLDNIRRLNHRSSFSCASESEIRSGELVEVGQVVFQPGQLTRPLYLPEHAVAEWRHSEIQQLDAKLARDGRGGVRASGSFDLRNAERGFERGSFELRADSDQAVLSVRDENNRSIVDFRAGEHGVRLNISDRHGRNLVRLLADSLGAALRGRH